MWSSWNVVQEKAAYFCRRSYLKKKRKRNSQGSRGHPSKQARFKLSILSFYTTNLVQISNRKETYVYHLKTRKTSHCKTAVSEISVFKSDTVLKQWLSRWATIHLTSRRSWWLMKGQEGTRLWVHNTSIRYQRWQEAMYYNNGTNTSFYHTVNSFPWLAKASAHGSQNKDMFYR